ncbi:MAG: amidophosphoribosyltransferase [Spirochaetaceae bacterium]
MPTYDCDTDHFVEECGVFGAYFPDADEERRAQLSRIVYYGLYSQQHRGQESAGMVLDDGDEFQVYKQLGLVAEVFSDDILDGLRGHAAVGHVRYSTRGTNSVTNAQPLVGQSRLGPLAIAHNGNLVNAPVIRDLLEDSGVMFQTSSDSEVILNLLARGSRYGLQRALSDTMRTVQGAFSVVILTREGLVGVRDPNGIRPLCIGSLEDGYVMASESCSLDAVGAELVRDVEPGEIVIITDDGVASVKTSERTALRTCSFEFIYFARPDSTIDGADVYETRRRAGAQLFAEAPVGADLVAGVPDSGVVAALGYAEASGIPFGMALIKNKYVGRSFIAPSQKLREQAVHVKLNVLAGNVRGKRVILIDDSIVRGTTSRRLVAMLKEAGATEVHVRVASPPVYFPCYFGIDTPSRRDLAASRGVEDIRDMTGADSLSFLSVDGLLASLGSETRFCTGCFTGVYPVAAPLEEDKLAMEHR